MASWQIHRRDANELEIKRALEAVGASVYTIDRPVDLLVGYRHVNYLLEIKTSTGKVEIEQRRFLEGWRGQAMVVRSVEEALQAIGATR